MGIRRVLTGAVLGLAGSALLALPAAAAAPGDPYPVPSAPSGGLVTNTTNVGVGGSIIVSGNNFAPGSSVTINVTVVNGFGRVATGAASASAPMRSLLSAGVTRAGAPSVQRLAASCVNSCVINADANGNFTVTVTLTHAGTNLITATGVDAAGNPRVLSTTVFVGGTGGAGGPGTGGTGTGSGSGSGSGSGGGSASGVGGLPNTGADLKVPVILGGALVLLGGGAVVAGRKRKQRVGTAA